ncbi:MAG: ABC transporter ATP-binding protein [Myxococcota bacterium]
MSAISTLVRPQRPRLAASGLLAVVAATLELAPAAGVFFAAKSVYEPGPATWSVPAIAATVFGLVLLRYVCFGSSLILSHAAAFRLLRELRETLAAKLGRVPRAFFDARSPGELKKAMVEDVDALEASFAHHIPDGASGVVTPLIAFFVLLFVDWRLALVSLALVPVGFAAMAFAMRNFDEMMKDWHAAERRANEVVLELLRGIVVLKAYGRDATKMKRVREGVFGVRDFADGLNKRSAPAYNLFILLVSSNLVVVLPVGVALYTAGAIDKPVLVLFLALGYGLTSPLMKLMFLFGDVQMNQVRLRRIGNILHAEEQSSVARAPVKGRAAGITVEQVSFTYDEARGPALSNVTLSIEPGQRVALVGPSGAGKSTLAQLLAGARDPSTGEVALLADDERFAPRGSVSLVGQQAQLFFGSLRENLLMARPQASDEDLATAARAAGLEEVLQRLPNGWDTEVGERGAHLSGGEAQRVTVARALLRDAPVVVLDEVTSHLDPDNERAVQQGIEALAKGRTLIVVAHRLRAVADADRIVVLDQGALVDSGTHQELLQRCHVYRRMWQAQEEAAEWTLGTPPTDQETEGLAS